MLSRTGGRRAAIAVLTVAVSSAAALWLYRRHKTRSKLTTLARLEEEEARKARLAKGEQRQKLTDMTKVVTTQPTTAEEWYTIGRELPFDGSAVIDGVTYSEVELFLRAISLDSSYAPPWNGLGSVCGPHGQVHVPGFGDLTQQEFYEMAVERDETLVRAWVNLARSNGLLLPLTINGVTYNTKQDLVKKALAVNPAYAEAWRIIANTAFESDDLTEDDTIDINGAKYTVPECAIRSLELGDTSAWLTLTMWMDRFGVEKIAVRGEEYTMTDTLKLCVLLDPTEATYWENLATHSRLMNVASVELGGKAWTVLELYREAILVCPSSWKSVYCFFELSGPDIHQVTLNYGDGNVATGCDLAGFAIHEAGPSEAVTVAMAYVALLENARVGKRSSIVVKHRKHPVGPVLQEEELTVLETIQRLETFCADNELFWVLVSRYLNDGLINYANTYTTKSGKVLNATAAAVVALEINENCASAWHYAGLSLLTESNRQEKPLEEFGVKLNDRTEDLSAIQCFVHALDLNTGASDSWLALAQSLKKTHQQHVMICERVHTRLDCWANALDLDDTPESASWVDFGLDLPEGHTYELGKRQIVVRRADCFVAALQIDPMNPQAWHALATALAPGATVAVNGEVELDKKQCEVRAAQHVVEQRTSLAARIWCSLAELLEDDSDVVVVEGDTLHRIDCVLRSLGAAQSKQAWKLLGEFLGPDEEAYLAERDERVDKETCFANAANLPE